MEKAKMDSEKLTINIGAIDLGHIDLLVEQGFYSSRSDFIRTSIRNQIGRHSGEIEKMSSDMTIVGLARYDRRGLEKIRDSGAKLCMRLVGMLILADDVSPELVRQAFESVKVYGILRAPAAVRALIAAGLSDGRSP
jgi:Arc/MetJ-type ribon-helix-helix transcriptional regulator